MVGRSSLTYLRDQVDEWGWRGVPKSASELLHKFPNRTPEPVWNREWDVLVVLDACRLDWMQAVVDEYEFLDTPDSLWSVGGHSTEWLEKTFSEGPESEIRNTAYVSANHFANDVAGEPFAHFENVNELAYDGDFPAAPAHVVTDRAVSVGREQEWDRLIVHYMQPHKPFMRRVGERDEVRLVEWSTGTDLYHEYFDGRRSLEELHTGYLENLRYVLDEVAILLENVSADTVAISADHGHNLGERFLWDHRQRVQHPLTRKVPWIETEAKDTESLTPPEYEASEHTDSGVQEQLRALGYR